MNYLIRAAIAVAAVAAVFVVPASSSAAPLLTCDTAQECPVGTKILATNVAHSGTPTQTVMETSAGNIVCGTATLTGEVTKNSGTEVQGEITTANFAGTHEVTTTGHCSGNFVIGNQITPTPGHTSDNVIHNGLKSLPWCLTANNKDNFKLRGGTCGAQRAVTFTIHGNISCSYEKEVVEGTFTTHPADLFGTIVQTFSRMTNSSAFCPATGTLKMAFTLSTDNAGAAGPAIFMD